MTEINYNPCEEIDTYEIELKYAKKRYTALSKSLSYISSKLTNEVSEKSKKFILKKITEYEQKLNDMKQKYPKIED